MPEDVKSARLKALQDLLNSQQLAFNEASVGRTMDMILERPGKEKGQLIGRTPLKLFAPWRENPFLYQAGDRLKFVSISTEKFAQIAEQEA